MMFRFVSRKWMFTREKLCNSILRFIARYMRKIYLTGFYISIFTPMNIKNRLSS
jgi:hypothetical protein